MSKIKQGPQESLVEYVKRFYQEEVLMPDLEDEVAYISFFNGPRSSRFKFFLAEPKETTFVEALSKAADFIRATEICTDNSDAPKKARILGDKNLSHGNKNPDPRGRRPPFKAIDPLFATDARSILMEVRGYPMLRRPRDACRARTALHILPDYSPGSTCR